MAHTLAIPRCGLTRVCLRFCSERATGERSRRERPGSGREESDRGAIAKRATGERSRRERESETEESEERIDREKMRRVFKQAFWCRG